MRDFMTALILGLLFMVLAFTPVAAQAPGAGIANTAHDFSGSVGGGEEAGLCTFCHTPHRAAQTLLLWNHRLSTNTFRWDVPTTTAGTTFPTFQGDTYRGPTTKCLSCHDGSVAIGDVAWFRGQANRSLDSTTHGEGDRVNVGFGGNMAGNHPVAMPYPYQNARNTYNGVQTGAGAVLNEWQVDPTTLNIRLFNDDGAGNISAGPIAARTGIECSSCHDPHNKASVEEFFLRGLISGNSTAYICLKCHIK
jgi:predicted CXXCH cytochrome family protein